MLNDKLSKIGANLQGSEIRRLFAVSMRPNVISFAGGLPDAASFPSEQIAKVTKELMSSKGEIYLQYGGSRGSQEGILAAIYRLKKNDIMASPEEIIMVSGSQQAINLVTQVLVDPGDIIMAENPTFIGALGVFRNASARVLGIPICEDGIDISAMKKILDQTKGEKLKFFYIITNFQNPTGLTTSIEKRREILHLANEYDFFILEDDPYGELWFEGGKEETRPIKAFDTQNRVIYTSSFSKIISPGIRLAWVAAFPELVERLDMAKQMADVCSNPWMQAVAYELTMSGFLDEHIEKLRHIYHSRRDAMLQALEQNMPDGVQWTRPKGGFYIWITLPKKINALQMLQKALDNNVAYVIGSAFYPDSSGKNTLRISFCHENEEIIREGVKRLSIAVKGCSDLE